MVAPSGTRLFASPSAWPIFQIDWAVADPAIAGVAVSSKATSRKLLRMDVGYLFLVLAFDTPWALFGKTVFMIWLSSWVILKWVGIC